MYSDRVEQWKYEYVLHNAHAMTARDLADALLISDCQVYVMAKEMNIEIRRSLHFKKNRNTDDDEFIIRPSRMNMLTDQELLAGNSYIVKFHLFKTLASFFYVEDLAEMMRMSKVTIAAKIRSMGMKPK